jgi:hypothetical protein
LALTKSIAVALPFFVTLVPIDAKMLAHLRLQTLIEDRFNQLPQRRRVLK